MELIYKPLMHVSLSSHSMSTHANVIVPHILLFCDARSMAAVAETNHVLREYCLARIYSCLFLTCPDDTRKWFRRLVLIPARAALVEEIVVSGAAFSTIGDLHINAFGQPRTFDVASDLVSHIRYMLGCTDNLLVLHIADAEVLLSSDPGIVGCINRGSSLGTLVLTEAGVRCAAMLARTPNICTVLVQFQHANHASSHVDLSGNTLGMMAKHSLQWLALTGDVTFPGGTLRPDSVYRCLTILDLNITSVSVAMILLLFPHLEALRLGAYTTLSDIVHWSPHSPDLIALQCSLSSLLDLLDVRCADLTIVDFARVSEYDVSAVANRLSRARPTSMVLTGWGSTGSQTAVTLALPRLTALTVQFIRNDDDVEPFLVRHLPCPSDGHIFTPLQIWLADENTGDGLEQLTMDVSTGFDALRVEGLEGLSSRLFRWHSAMTLTVRRCEGPCITSPVSKWHVGLSRCVAPR